MNKHAIINLAVAMVMAAAPFVQAHPGDAQNGSRVPKAILPATSHTAVISQPELLMAFIEPFLKGETPKGFFEE